MILAWIVAGFWSQEDIEALVVAVRSGVLTVRYAGPPAREMTYQSLASMRALLAEMRRDVAGGPTRRLAKFRKGFRDVSNE